MLHLNIFSFLWRTSDSTTSENECAKVSTQIPVFLVMFSVMEMSVVSVCVCLILWGCICICSVLVCDCRGACLPKEEVVISTCICMKVCERRFKHCRGVTKTLWIRVSKHLALLPYRWHANVQKQGSNVDLLVQFCACMYVARGSFMLFHRYKQTLDCVGGLTGWSGQSHREQYESNTLNWKAER